MNRTDPLRTEQEINRFLHYMAEWSGVYFVGCCIGMNWGLRASDILSLTVGDVVAGTGKRIQIRDRIQVTEQKTGKVRDIPITPKMKAILAGHVRQLKGLKDFSPELPLVVSHKRNADGTPKALSRVSFYKIISYAAGELGLSRKGRHIGTHSLRKTYAFQAWRNGARIDEIQKEFGHADSATTHRYACIPDERLDRLFELTDFGNKEGSSTH